MWGYYAFKVARLTLSRLPKRIGYMIVCLIADIVYTLSPARRAIVADNISQVLGPKVDKAILKKTVRGVLRNTGKNYFDLIKIPRLKLGDIERSITVHGWPHLEQALKKGKGVMLVTAHLGSFDMAMQMFAARSIKVTILVELLESPSLLRHITRLRESKGLTVLPVRLGTSRVAVQSLRRGEIVLVACDRSIQGDSLTLRFFGKETNMPVGAIKLAMRTEAAIIPVFNLRRTDGRYDIFLEQPLEIASAGKEALVKNMKQVITVMEKYIRKCPEQWVVLNRIWQDGR